MQSYCCSSHFHFCSRDLHTDFGISRTEECSTKLMLLSQVTSCVKNSVSHLMLFVPHKCTNMARICHNSHCHSHIQLHNEAILSAKECSEDVTSNFHL
jgi:hypothetical protein